MFDKKFEPEHLLRINDDMSIRNLIDRLVEAESTIQSCLGGQVDAVLDPIRRTPLLLREAQEALMEEARIRRLAAILQNVQDCIIVVDCEGIITYWNDGAAALFGYAADEALGRSLALIYPEQNPAILRSDLNKVVKGKDIQREWKGQHRNGTGVWADVRMTRRANGGGDLSGFIVVARDITERKRAEERLRQSESKLKSLSHRLLSAQEDERKRVAMELHDSVAASLSAIKLRLEKELDHSRESTAGRQLIHEAIRLMKNLTDEVRRIMGNLHPAMLDDLGLIPAMRSHCRTFEGLHPDMKITTSIGVEESDIREQLKIVIFRIMQEALTNIGKHSRADHAQILLGMAGRALELRVKDNGRGFDAKNVSSSKGAGQGMGIESMKERARLSGGALVIYSQPGRGTTVRALWRPGVHGQSDAGSSGINACDQARGLVNGSHFFDTA